MDPLVIELTIIRSLEIPAASAMPCRKLSRKVSMSLAALLKSEAIRILTSTTLLVSGRPVTAVLAVVATVVAMVVAVVGLGDATGFWGGLGATHAAWLHASDSRNGWHSPPLERIRVAGPQLAVH